MRAFLARVEGFFKDMEAEASAAQAEVQALLTDAGHRQAARQSPLDASAEPPAPILRGARTGEVVVIANPRHASPATSPSAPPSPAIPMAWEVASVDRTTLDLEALRPFLTEASLLAAARAHMKARGPHALRGAAYADRAQLP